jgi:hypothetical protein
MRKLLASQDGTRKKFRGIFSRFGKKQHYKGYVVETILIINVTDAEDDIVLTDHIWFNLTKGFEKLNLTPGAVIEFEARVTPYKKGYVNRRYKINERKIDFRLSHPTRLKVILNPGAEDQ